MTQLQLMRPREREVEDAKIARVPTTARRNRVWLPLWLLLPSILVLLAMQVYPAIYAAVISFARVRRGELEFIGWRNYERLLSAPSFLSSLERTLIYSVFYVLITLTLGIVLALLLNRRFKFTSLYLVLIFIPWVLSDVVTGTMWRWLFQPDYGILQEWLHNTFPFVSDALFASRDGAMGIVIAASIWQALAFATILALGALQTVPQEVIESAAIDGADRFQRFFSIILPIARPTFLIMLLLLSIRAVNTAGLIFATTGGGPGDATTTASIYLVDVVKDQGEFGLGGAISVLLLGVNIILTVVYLSLFGRKVEA
ncbi:MAG: sugar ABC transporter permease [Anaerolineae bacterium]|nr:sugar ABC transporter permease [Anaerolineae bacterium]